MVVENKTQNLLYGGILATIAIIFAVFSWSTPYLIDDLQFIGVYRSHSGGADTFSLSAWIEYMLDIRSYDNSRLSNIFAPFSTIIQPWCSIFPILTGLCTAALVALMVSLIGERQNRWLYAIVLWGLMMAFLPWRDSIIVRDYLLNYIYGATITLLALYLLLKYEQKGWTYARFVICLLLYVIAGAWHEGFAVSMIAGMFLYAVYKHKTISQQWWILTFFYGIIALLFLFSPGMLNRANIIIDNAFTNFSLSIITSLFPVYILVINLLVMVAIPSGRRILSENFNNPIWFISLFACVAGCALIIFLNASICRMAMFPDILALINLFITFRYSLAKFFKHTWLKIVVSVGYVVLLCQAILIISCLQAIKQDAEYIEVASRNSTFIFYDIIRPEATPIVTMNLPPKYALFEPFHYLSLRNAHLKNNIPSVVPTSLTDADMTNSKALTRGSLDLYIHDGLLWSTHKMMPHQKMLIYTSKGDFENVSAISRFINTTGDTCYHIFIKKLDTSECVGIDLEDEGEYEQSSRNSYNWDIL